jgi:hypothetical protein
MADLHYKVFFFLKKKKKKEIKKKKSSFLSVADRRGHCELENIE